MRKSFMNKPRGIVAAMEENEEVVDPVAVAPAVTEPVAVDPAAVDPAAVAATPVEGTDPTITPAVATPVAVATATDATPPAEGAAPAADSAAEPVVMTDNADSVETDMLEIKDAEAEVMVSDIEMAEAEEVSEAMEAIGDSLKISIANGGLDRSSAAIVTTSINYMNNIVGIRRKTMPSLEAYGGVTTRVEATTLALETVQETLKKIWEAIISAIKKSIDFVKNLYDKYIAGAGKMVSRAQDMAKKVDALKDKQASVKEIENERLFKSLRIGAAVPTNDDAVKYFETIGNAVFSKFAEESKAAGQGIVEALKASDNPEKFEDAAVNAIQISNVRKPELTDFNPKGDAEKDILYAHTKELPGGKALVQMYIDPKVLATGGDNPFKVAMGLIDKAGYKHVDYDLEASIPAGTKVPVLTTAQMTTVTSAVETIAKDIVNFKKQVELLTGLKTEAAKLAEAASAKATEANAEQQKAIQKIAKSAISKIDQPAAMFTGYALSTCKAYLDQVELSMKEYK